MSLVKAKCLKCNEEIEIENGEEAGNCPKCGTAFITDKVIKNYQASLQPQSKNKKVFEGFDEYVEKYNAFTSLYDVDFSALLKVYQKANEVVQSNKETKNRIEEYNDAVKKTERKRDSYNRKVEGFNDAKYTAGADSWSEKLHTKYLDGAHKKYEDSKKEAYEKKNLISENEAATKRLIQEKEALEEKVGGEIFGYNRQASMVVEQMCQKYPSNPISYIYKANWYRRELDWQKKFIKYVEDIYEEGSEIISLVKNDFAEKDYQKKYNAELKKAEKFMTDELREENKEVIKSLTGAVKQTKKQATSAEGRSSSSTSKKSSTSKSTSPAKKGRTSTKGIMKDSGKKSTKIMSEKTYEKKVKNMKRRHKLYNFIFSFVCYGGILVAIVVLLLKYVFKVF